MVLRILKIAELINTSGAFFAFIKWRKFSLAAFKIISRARLAGVEPRTVIDVGANIGKFTIASYHLFQGVNIFSIEPDPRVAKQLRKNISKKFAANIRITALGSDIGQATLCVNSDSQVSSILPLGKDRIKSFPKSKVVEEINIPITTLDTLFEGVNIERPILLKIDVQGYEDRVILGSCKTLQRIQWIIIEVSYSNLYEGESDFEKIVEILRLHGFRFIRPLNFHTSPTTGEIIEMDALFGSVRHCA